mgnify:CR=1 FL=1
MIDEMINKPNLLIVDDSKYLAGRLAERAIDGGVYNPVVVHSYSELTAILKTSTVFFAGVIDLMLPDCADGEAVKLTIEHNIPSIALTGSMDETLRNKIIVNPIVDFLLKTSQEDIYSAISLAEHIYGFKGKKVLIIDTSPTRVKYLSKFFQELLFEVISVDTADDAFEILNTMNDVEIVTVNNERSDMLGSDIIKNIRQNPQIRHSMKNRSVVTFGISSESSDYLRSVFIKSGANDLLSLPITKEEFNAKVLNNLNMMHTVEELKVKNEELKRTVKVLEEYNKAVDAGGIVSKSDVDGIITYANDAFCHLTGYSREEMIGKPHSIFRHASTPKAVFKDLWDTIQAGDTWMGNVKNVRKDGSEYYVFTTIIPIKDNHKNIFEYVAIRQDISELVKNREELQNQFQTDPLTSLGNRTKMLNDIKNIEQPMLAVVDIDRFYEINGFYGNEIGDNVLKELGDRLFDYFCDKIYSVYRINSDQFAVLTCENCINSTTFTSQVMAFSKMVRNCTFRIKDIDIDISLTTCIVEESGDVLSKVDMSLKSAKLAKKDFIVYEEGKISETKAYKNNILWTKVIKSALKNDMVVPYYQPIYNNQTGKIEKYEALMRIMHGKKLITPYHFMDIAKRTKYYPHLTGAMIKKSFDLFSKTRNILSINLSVEDIANKETLEDIYEYLEAYMIGDRITFEIVESEGIENYEEVESFIRNVKEIGCSVAIDDFGSGYSNFEYLMKLKADYIKIDGSIISKICEDESALSVTEAIVTFAARNSMQTVAEFVSNEAIQAKVLELGVNYSQGYLFGKPSSYLIK